MTTLTYDEIKILAAEWHGQAGGELLPRLTVNELAGLVNQILAKQAESAAAKHWHDLYIAKCQELHDEIARLGAEIETLELAAIDDANLTFWQQAEAVPAVKVNAQNVGRWCLSEDYCIEHGIDFSSYERGVQDAANAFDASVLTPAPQPVTQAVEVMRNAAQAVVDRWDTPLWKDAPATADYINRLRAALAAITPNHIADAGKSITEDEL